MWNDLYQFNFTGLCKYLNDGDKKNWFTFKLLFSTLHWQLPVTGLSQRGSDKCVRKNVSCPKEDCIKSYFIYHEGMCFYWGNVQWFWLTAGWIVTVVTPLYGPQSVNVEGDSRDNGRIVSSLNYVQIPSMSTGDDAGIKNGWWMDSTNKS